MPYLFSIKNQILLVNKTSDNLYLRYYPSHHNQRMSVMVKSIFNDYTAQLDELEHLHIIYKSSANNLVHLFEDNNKFTKKVILDDYNNSYQVTNLRYLYDKKHYLFYCAVNPYEGTSDLIFHPFTNSDEESSPQSLFTLTHLNAPYECTIHNGILYLLSTIVVDQEHQINLYQYHIKNEQWDHFETIRVLKDPVTSLSLCINQHGYHVAYEVKSGEDHTIYYTKKINDWSKPQSIYSSRKDLFPVLFLYNDLIWLNWRDNTLMNCMSADYGYSFTEPLPCSVQNKSAIHYYFYHYTTPSLSGHKFYGFIDREPYLSVLSQVDTEGILPYQDKNNEVKSIVDNIHLLRKNYKQVEALQKENSELKEVQNTIKNQYNELAGMAKKLQEEGKKWKSKYLRSDMELKKVRGRISNMKSNLYQKKEDDML